MFFSQGIPLWHINFTLFCVISFNILLRCPFFPGKFTFIKELLLVQYFFILYYFWRNVLILYCICLLCFELTKIILQTIFLLNIVINNRVIMEKLNLNHFVVINTKLDKRFQNAKLDLNEYNLKATWCRDKHWEGLTQLAK